MFLRSPFSRTCSSEFLTSLVLFVFARVTRWLPGKSEAVPSGDCSSVWRMHYCWHCINLPVSLMLHFTRWVLQLLWGSAWGSYSLLTLREQYTVFWQRTVASDLELLIMIRPRACQRSQPDKTKKHMSVRSSPGLCLKVLSVKASDMKQGKTLEKPTPTGNLFENGHNSHNCYIRTV